MVLSGFIIYNISDNEINGWVPSSEPRRIGDDEMRNLKKNGFNPHEEKPSQGSGGPIDFYTDNKGWIFYKQVNSDVYNPILKNMKDFIK